MKSEKTYCQCCGKKRAGGGMRFCLPCYGIILSSETTGETIAYRPVLKIRGATKKILQ